MNKENLQSEIEEGVARLLSMARSRTYNVYSNNCLYILSKITDGFYNERRRVGENKNKKPKPLSAILSELEALYPILFDINLMVYRANKKVTIIEIAYFSRLSLDEKYRIQTESKVVMLHCKLIPPRYISSYFTEYQNKKFDINWMHKPMLNKWKIWWWQYRMNKKFKKVGY